MHRVFTPIIFLLLLQGILRAQESPVAYKTPEEGFALMQQHAADQEYTISKQIAYQLLEENPDYHDVSLYLARLYGWESEYDSAYSIVNGILLQDSSLLEAHIVRVDLAYWENDWLKLVQYAELVLEMEPDLPEVEEKYLLAKQRLIKKKESTEIMVGYTYDHFSKPYVRNWHMLTVGAIVPTDKAVFSPYINTGYHPGIEGTSSDIQFNLDAYFNLGLKTYAMAGYGFSPNGTANFLPGHRAALEVWQVLPAGFAISGGLRYFYWEEHFTFLTLSGEKYLGDYWFSLRTYLFSKDYGISSSWYLSGRRYFANKYDYLTATIGYGTAPDEPLLVVSDLDRLNALSVRVGFSKKMRENLRMETSVGYAYEEYDDQQYRNRFSFNIGLYIKIK